jgi:hypothetical protein
MSTIFTSGTKTFFQQSSAPTGWTKDTTNYNNHFLRVVNGSVSSGGTIDFSTVFKSTPYSFTNVSFPGGKTDLRTLSVSNLPIHTHGVFPQNEVGPLFETPVAPLTTPSNPVTVTISPTNFGGTTPSSGSNEGHQHNLSVTASGDVCNIDIKYVDVIIASLD